MGTNTATYSAKLGIAVTPHASTNLIPGCRGIYVGVGGAVAVVWGDDSVTVFAGVPTGAILPVQAKRINAVGTDATTMIALY